MSLEDHLGDILRKAREAARLSPEQAAAAAGLDRSDYSRLEESGRTSTPLKLDGLCRQLGLDPAKLAAVAAGWTPAPVNLSVWREVRQITTSGAGMSVSCYLIWDEVTREDALFDTGFDAQPVFDLIDREVLQLRHLFITHTHEDHVAALGAIRARFPKVRLHSSSRHAPLDQRNRANDFVHLGSLRITNRDTPGHAEDGVTYVVGNFPEDAPNVALVGDALFAGSIGGARDAASLARQKVREQILSLPAETLLCPGHGPLTTVAEERANNPFF